MVSVRRVAPVLLVFLAISAFGATKASRSSKSSSSRPPRQLHRSGDHWTAYNPPDPATYPANAQTYAVKAGDTLWGLANQFYKNAYLWPQLWEANTWITDAHWIYPGDVLLVEGEAAAGTTASTSSTTTTPALTQTAPAEEQAAPSVTEPTVRVARPVPLGTEADVYCYGYIGDPREPMPNSVAGFEDVETRYVAGAESQDIGVAEGELIFINGGTSTGIIPGETYIAIEPGGMVNHPRSKDALGRYYDYRGQVKILCADATKARAIITRSCKEIHIGARLKPLPQLPIPLVRIPPTPGFCDPQSGKTNGYIISSLGWELGLAEGNLVAVNLGKVEQVTPGDFLTVYRDSPVAGQPPQILGEIGILTTEEHTATGKIVDMRRSMQVGDHVEAR
jgi:hypothetical protein